jgi:hypothetical protein
MRLNVHRLAILGALIASILVVEDASRPRVLTTVGFSQAQQRQPRRTDTSQLPVVEFEGGDLPTKAEAATIARKSKRYNGRHLKDSSSSELSIGSSHWLLKLPPIPASISDVILVGTVVQAKAFLAEDKAGVYSEFTIHVEQLLKTNGHIPVAINDLFPVEREGGRIKYPSGRTRALILEFQGTPLVGHRYLFFVRRSEEGPNDLMIVAYEVVDGKIVPLDGRSLGDGHLLPQFAPFDGVNSEQFLNQVRTAIAAEAARSPISQN